MDYPHIEKITPIVQQASKLMQHSGFEIKSKGGLENLVTSSDIAVQHFLTTELGKLLPGSGFLCEEEDLNDITHDAVWIIDPIDGTANYTRGLPKIIVNLIMNLVSLSIPPTRSAEIASFMTSLCVSEIFFPDNMNIRSATVTIPSPPIWIRIRITTCPKTDQ